MDTFGAIVRRTREKGKRWTQAQLAERVGVLPPMISKIENGESCSIEVFRALVLALEIDPSDAIHAPITPLDSHDPAPTV